VRKRIREEELECYAKGFKALRANAGNISRRAAEAAQHRISHLRAHLELLSQVRAEHPDVMFYLSDAWEKRTVQDEMDMFVKKGLIKPRKGATLYRKYEEKREADILQKLEKVLADIVGGESTNV
jgi:predicted transcriptional regulator